MPKIQNHEFPENLWYDIANQIWYEPLPDGTVRVGFTPIAMELAGEVLVFTPKRIGKPFEPDKWFAMIECGKWIGAARAAFEGTVVAYNETLVDRPELLNRDAFGGAWMLIVKPDKADWQSGLTPGRDLASAYEAWLKAEEYKNRRD